MVRFSILVPIYNGEKYINECIDSILSQTYNNFELVIVDDGSTDNSGVICDEYTKKDNRVRVFHQENKGRYAARISCLNNANGEYMFFVDADDYIALDCLEKINKQIEKSSADVVIFDHFKENYNRQYEYIDSFENIDEGYLFDVENKRELYLQFLSTHKLNSLCLKVFRKCLLNLEKSDISCGIFQMGEDAFISAQIYKEARSILYFKYAPYYYRRNLGSIVNSFSFEKLYGWEKMLEEKHNFRINVQMNDTNTKSAMANYNLGILKDMAEVLADASIPFKEKKQNLKCFRQKVFYKKYMPYVDFKKLTFKMRIFYLLFKSGSYRMVLLAAKLNYRTNRFSI